ncbi:hypothetical protein GTA08_BOTSDO01081 [Botryosphaeria dothidea]|uniref:Uncharacterized protein n=1 Tax=Botryosphaeria dothidea TaxID=55169 RepID=A0A8H4J7G9_9PEZI|nr:hypothetical protein GTA08_BOTSDO01081 [Botryosphaeria dothidea]
MPLTANGMIACAATRLGVVDKCIGVPSVPKPTSVFASIFPSTLIGLETLVQFPSAPALEKRQIAIPSIVLTSTPSSSTVRPASITTPAVPIATPGASAPTIISVPTSGLSSVVVPSGTAPGAPDATPPSFFCPADDGKIVTVGGLTFQIRCGVSIGLRLAVPRLFGSGGDDIGLCLGTCVLLGYAGAGINLDLTNQNNCQCYTQSTDLVVDPSKIAAVLIPT